MPDRHPDRDCLEGFLQGELAPADRQQVVRHLLSGCPSCRGRAEAAWAVAPGQASSEGLDSRPLLHAPSLERVLVKAQEKETELAEQRQDASRLLDELEGHPLGRQLTLVRNSRRFQTWGLCEFLLQKSWESRFDDATKTLELAELGLAVAESLDAGSYGVSLVQDLKARAWGLLANAHRITSDLRSAEEAFRIAESLLEEGTEDPLEKARILEMKAALRTDQSRWDEAKRLLDRVIALYRRAGDRHLLGVAVAEKGRVCGHADQPEEAVRLIREALESLDPKEDPRDYLAARHNLVFFLSENGNLDEALSLLQETRPLYAQLGDRLNLLRLRWLEGQIAVNLGKVNLAEAALLEARNGFVAQGIGYDAALVSMELATIYARQGRTVEMRQLAAQMIPIFQSRGVHREAIAALIVFQKAAQVEAATVELVQEVLTYLEKAQDNPELRFRKRS